MLTDGLEFTAGSNVVNSKIEAAATLPITNLANGKLLVLTAQDGQNEPGLYAYVNASWHSLISKAKADSTYLQSTTLNSTNVLGALGFTPLDRAGGTMTGALVLHGDPTLDLHAATKQYTDGVGNTKLSLSGGTLTGALILRADPTTNLGAATKQYVDSVASGLEILGSSRVATTENITLAGLQTIDGIAVVANDRVLVKNQTNQTQNGVYVASSGSWARAADFNSTANMHPGAYTLILEGTTQGGASYAVTTKGVITPGTTNIVWTQFTSIADINSDYGITKIGNALSVNVTELLGTGLLDTNNKFNVDVTGLAGYGLLNSSGKFALDKSAVPYDIAGNAASKPAAGATIFKFKTPRAFQFAANMAGSYAISDVAATGNSVFTLYKNGVSFATFTFAAAGSTATFSNQSAVNFVVGDVIHITAPATQDATLADIYFTLAAPLV